MSDPIKAFPNSFERFPTEEGMDLRDYFAIRAPEPSKEYIEHQGEIDRLRNPHGDNYKPPRRSTLEIITQYKYQYADVMMEARKV